MFLNRAVQIDPVTRSIRRIDRIRPESGRPDCSGGSAAGLHHQKPIPVDRFRFSSPKTRKTRTDRKITRLRPKFSDSGDSLQESGEETHISVIFPLDPVRFWPNLAISHQIRWDFRRIWRNLTGSWENIAGIWKTITGIWVFCRICVLFTVFLPCSQMYDSDWPARHPLMVWTVRSDYFGESAAGAFFFSLDSGGSVSGWAQTRPGPTRGQPYF